MPNNPITDEQLAELDRLQHGTTPRPWLYGKVWLDHVPNYMAVIALHNACPALRQRLLDAEARLAEAERERDAYKAQCSALLDAINIQEQDQMARDAQQRREGAVEAFNEMRRQAEEVGQQSGLAKKMCKVFADECIEQAANRLREGKNV